MRANCSALYPVCSIIAALPDFSTLCRRNNYTLYAAVPISEIRLRGELIGVKAAEVGPPYLVADLVICQENTIRLIVLLEDDWRKKAWCTAGSHGPAGAAPTAV